MSRPAFASSVTNRPQLGLIFTPKDSGKLMIMAVTVEMHNTGDSARRAEVLAAIEHVLSDRQGNWRVTIVGSRENDDWDMKLEGPAAFERLYTLVGADGEHRPEVIRNLLMRMMPVSAR